jgi:tetratricopeptide (TPR) repeat protein
MSEVKSISQVLLEYESAIEILESADRQPTSTDVLGVLMKRDALQSLVLKNAELLTDFYPEKVIAIADLDKRLKKQQHVIVKLVKLSEWRAILEPTEKHWWWFFPSQWDRFDWLWNTLSIAALAVSLSLLINTSTKILSGGATSGTTLVVVGQSFLTLLAGGGALTQAGKEGYEKALIRLHIDKNFWQEISCGLSLLLMCSLFGINYSLPNWAIAVNRNGVENYKNKRIESAKGDFERAIAMRPDYGEARYNLGWLYEEINDLDKAKAQYELAVQGDLQKFDKEVNHLKALNNLGRLYILKKEYGTAVLFLNQGIQESESTKSMTSGENSSEGGVYYSEGGIYYNLRKNMGWARLMQERYAESEVQLRSAIALNPKRSFAYCLLAQVVEAKEPSNQAIALEFWTKCISYATPRDFSQSEGDDWYGLANKRLDKAFSNKDTSKDK